MCYTLHVVDIKLIWNMKWFALTIWNSHNTHNNHYEVNMLRIMKIKPNSKILNIIHNYFLSTCILYLSSITLSNVIFILKLNFFFKIIWYTTVHIKMCIYLLKDRKQGDIQTAAAKVMHTFRLATKFCHQFTQINQAKPKTIPIGNNKFK